MDDHRAFSMAAETGLLDLRTLALPAVDSAQSLQAQRRSLTARVEAELGERRQQVGRLPDPVDAFLGTHWMQYLVNCLDTHGPEASPWRQGLATADALLWSVSPKEGAAQQRLAELRPRMTRRLRQGMDQVGVSMFEQEAFLETLETILDRAQAGQPVWDWDQESAIDALLGVDEPLALPSGAVSVVELDKPQPVRLVVPRPPRPASQPPAVVEEVAVEVDEVLEETISIEDLAAELSAEDIAPLDLPTVVDMVEEPVEMPGIEGDYAEAQIEVLDPDELSVESAALDDVVEEAAGDALIETCEVTEIVDVIEALDVAEPTTACKAPELAAEAAEPAAPANSLEALMRRRGLSAIAHVEEVELTERSGRG
jgi:hypothetical protein